MGNSSANGGRHEFRDRPEAIMNISASVGGRPIEPSLIGRVLEPYHANCRYLVEGLVSYAPGRKPLLEVDGLFRIPTSCYIKETGHFNAVDLNIAYNQIAFCALAHAIQQGWLARLCDWTLEQFLHRQLTNCMILRLTSRFKQPLEPRELTGHFTLLSIRELIQDILIGDTTCEFTDRSGAVASGEVQFAIHLGSPSHVAGNTV